MENLILDSDILIDVLRRVPSAIEFISELDSINVSIYTALELLDGCRNKEEIITVNKLLKGVTIIPATTNSQNIALRIFHKYKLSNGIGLVDSLIAGIAYEQDYIVITRNIKHYSFIDDIKVIAPYKI